MLSVFFAFRCPSVSRQLQDVPLTCVNLFLNPEPSPYSCSYPIPHPPPLALFAALAHYERSHVNDHILAGMQAFYTVHDRGTPEDEFFFGYNDNDTGSVSSAQAVEANEDTSDVQVCSPRERESLCVFAVNDDSPSLRPSINQVDSMIKNALL